jgi:hypothetical protein
MKLFFGILLRLVCYPALLVVSGGLGIMIFLGVSGVCPKFELSGIECTSRFYNDLAANGITIMLLTVFNGYPLLLALGGVYFIVRDVVGLLRRRRANAFGTDAR